jgi:hypothetical protein
MIVAQGKIYKDGADWEEAVKSDLIQRELPLLE